MGAATLHLYSGRLFGVRTGGLAASQPERQEHAEQRQAAGDQEKDGADPPLAIVPSQGVADTAAGRIALSVIPQDDGRQRFEVTALDHQGSPLGGIQRVLLRIRFQQPETGPTTLDAVLTAEGRYAIASGLLSTLGSYDVEVVVRRQGAEDLSVPWTLRATLSTLRDSVDVD